jgi:hypothetical protein
MTGPMGVTSVRRVGKLLPLWRWENQQEGRVVAKGFARSEDAAWAKSIKKVPRKTR